MQIQTELRQNAIETEQKLQEYLPQSEFEPVLRYCLLQGAASVSGTYGRKKFRHCG